MGVYLSSPITEKESIDGQSERFIYGASSMQGWRITQEDAHNCIPIFDEKTETSFFAVYDGHGGSEVAKYCERHFPDFMKNLMKIHGGGGDDPTLFIKNTFLAFDATLTNEGVIKELKQLAGKDADNAEKEDDRPVAHARTGLLKGGASMPLNRLLAQYKSSASREIKNVHKKESFQSPALRLKSGSSSDIEHSSQHAENGLSASHVSSPSPSLCKQDCSSEVSNGVSDVNNSSETVRSHNHESVTADRCDNEHKVNHTNIDKASSQPSHENLCSAVMGEVLQSSPHNERNIEAVKEDVIHPKASDKASDSCLLDRSTEQVIPPVNSFDEPSGKEASSAVDVGHSKSRAASDVDKVDGALDTSDEVVDDQEEQDDDDDLWEDVSDDDDDDEDEEEDEPDDDVPMMDVSNEEPGSDSGCTACVVLMQDKRLIVANAGDSRCILSRAGKAIDLSFDHKPEDDAERDRIEKAGGRVTADGRVNGGLNLSRAIGDHVYKRNKDLPAKEQMITALPDIETAELCDEDQFIVIACDGIWNYMTSQEVVDYVLEKLKDSENRKKPSQICEQLFDHCLAPNTFGDGTGCDNMTCIIIVLDTFIKSKVQQTSKEAADTKDTLHEIEEDSSEPQLRSLSDKEDVGSGSLKRCADSVEVPEGKRLKVEEEVA